MRALRVSSRSWAWSVPTASMALSSSTARLSCLRAGSIWAGSNSPSCDSSARARSIASVAWRTSARTSSACTPARIIARAVSARMRVASSATCRAFCRSPWVATSSCRMRSAVDCRRSSDARLAAVGLPSAAATIMRSRADSGGGRMSLGCCMPSVLSPRWRSSLSICSRRARSWSSGISSSSARPAGPWASHRSRTRRSVCSRSGAIEALASRRWAWSWKRMAWLKAPWRASRSLIWRCTVGSTGSAISRLSISSSRPVGLPPSGAAL
ncbi:MAG: hypothetical protein KatS3mg103_0234 [Phycisphaerales bacterium]|nr:MAG: hypothetical protein KatS3mg103_0234 [Phycisphaerales bacterium]